MYDVQRLCENLIVELKCDNGPTRMNKKGYFLEKRKSIFFSGSDGRRVSNWKDIIWQAWAAGSLEQGDTGPILPFFQPLLSNRKQKTVGQLSFSETTIFQHETQNSGTILPFWKRKQKPVGQYWTKTVFLESQFQNRKQKALGQYYLL